MKKILVTGGCGYIGGHTIVDLIANGFDVISVDDLSHGSLRMLQGIEKITGRPIKNYKVNLCDADDTETIFIENDARVAQIYFHECEPAEKYDGQWQNDKQRGSL